ncbi:MAG TPA: hypothetical protein VE617_01195 [Propionibacteriaceae bacterium]|nr:hypothetical protein [Propionibacteriaceae bacterium]
MRSRARWVALLLLLAGVFAGLRWISTLSEPPERSPVFTDQVVVVGVTGRPQLTEVDRRVIEGRASEVQAGAIAIRPRYVGECAAAGWATLGAGRRTTVGGDCAVTVTGGKVDRWADFTAAAAARRGDARLGTLAGAASGCVAAVGPGAALAAARPDGAVPAYATVEEFLRAGMATTCPITLVDGGDRADEVISALATDESRTLIVTGIGPAPGSDDPALQVFYRVGTTFPGWATSASTRRTGIVTLTDLTRTLVEFGAGPGAPAAATIDGSPAAVEPDTLSADAVAEHLAAVAALSDTMPAAYAVLGGLAGLLVAVGVVAVVRRNARVLRGAATVGSALPGAMLLTGTVPWEYSDRPLLTLSLTVAVAWAVLAGAAYGLSRLVRVPPVIVASALVVAAFTADAALGGPLQSGSMLNSRPVDALRWYGFGNSTFAAYATTGLLLAGYLAHRLLAAGQRRAAVVAVAVVGFGIVICQGWPSMGSDFGGVIALTPPVLWLVLVLSGIRVTPLRLLALGGAAVIAVGLISVLDWARGPDRRSHLGNFVQRILDGDAVDVVARKAVASWETIANPYGVASIILGVTVWVVAIRFLVPAVGKEFDTLGLVVHAVMATGVLGTLVNDGGIYVWLIATLTLISPLAWFWATSWAQMPGSPGTSDRLVDARAARRRSR